MTSLKLTIRTDEQTVEGISHALYMEGFRHDEEFQTLYGAGWAVIGVEVTDAAAAKLALEILDGTATR